MLTMSCAWYMCCIYTRVRRYHHFASHDIRKTAALSHPCKFPQDGAPGGMSGLPAAGAKTGGYVPPSIRNRAPGDTGDSMNKRREENSVRVTNLSEDTREDDLRVRG